MVALGEIKVFAGGVVKEFYVVFRKERIGESTLYLADCKDVIGLLRNVDAVVTDPPYGIGESLGKNKSRGYLAKAKDYGVKDWDAKLIDQSLFDKIKNVAKYSIIFGGNYYVCPPASCWFIWDKLNGNTDFADAEMAWTNLPQAVRIIKYRWHGFVRQNKEERGEHPTQKPVGVMRWCIEHLPLETNLILDPFMGSGTTGVAAILCGKRFVGVEIDSGYFDSACRRIEETYRMVNKVETTNFGNKTGFLF